MSEWQYLKVKGDSELSKLGEQGWELVAVVQGGAPDAPTLYLKRPGLDFREQVTLAQKRHYYHDNGIPLKED